MRTVLSGILLAISSLLRGAAYLLNRITIFVSLFFGVCFAASFLGSMLASTRIVYLVAAAIFSPFGLPALLNFLAGKLALASKSAKGNLGGKAGVPDLEAVPSDYEAIVKEGVENESYWDNKV